MDVYTLFPNADVKIKFPAAFVAIEPGDLAIKIEVYAVNDDPMNVPNCKMCLVKFLDGSPVAVRYRTRDLRRKVLMQFSDN